MSSSSADSFTQLLDRVRQEPNTERYKHQILYILNQYTADTYPLVQFFSQFMHYIQSPSFTPFFTTIQNIQNNRYMIEGVVHNLLQDAKKETNLLRLVEVFVEKYY